MTIKTDKQALRLSINHWKRMLKLTVEEIRDGGEYPSADNCALCHKYAFHKERPCVGCPVMKATGRTSCDETPFYKAADIYVNIYRSYRRNLSKFRAAVRKEIKFLESLKV